MSFKKFLTLVQTLQLELSLIKTERTAVINLLVLVNSTLNSVIWKSSTVKPPLSGHPRGGRFKLIEVREK